MKKIVSLLLLIAMAAALVIPAAAEEYWHDDPVMVIDIVGKAELTKEAAGAPISEKDMAKAVANCEEASIVSSKIGVKSYTLLWQRGIVSKEDYIDVALRVWGSRNLLALMFYRPEGSHEWEVYARNIGEIIDVCIPGGGDIAIAFATR